MSHRCSRIDGLIPPRILTRMRQVPTYSTNKNAAHCHICKSGVLLQLTNQQLTAASLGRVNPHAVERFVHKEDRHQEECDGKYVREHRIARSKRHSKLNSKQSEQRRELDDWIH